MGAYNKELEVIPFHNPLDNGRDELNLCFNVTYKMYIYHSNNVKFIWASETKCGHNFFNETCLTFVLEFVVLFDNLT